MIDHKYLHEELVLKDNRGKLKELKHYYVISK